MSSPLLVSVLWEGFLGSFLASIGFGVLFNVRSRALILAGLTGGIGGMVYKLALAGRLGDPMANFLAAMALSVLGEIFARRLKTTVTTFTACALIPLVPGGAAYEMMVEFSQGRPMLGLTKLMDVVTISGMLAIGILSVSTLTRFFFYSKRKIHSTRKRLYQKSVFEHPFSPKRRKNRAARRPVSSVEARLNQPERQNPASSESTVAETKLNDRQTGTIHRNQS